MKNSDIKEIFKDIKGSFIYDDKFIINKGSEVFHLNGNCNAKYTQEEIQVLKRYRCHVCNKSTKAIIIDDKDINTLPIYTKIPEKHDKTPDLSPDKESKKLTNTVINEKTKPTKEDFDSKFFDKTDLEYNGTQKEYDRVYTDSFDEKGKMIDGENLKRLLILMPRKDLFQLYLRKDELTDDDYKIKILEGLNKRGILSRCKNYVKALKAFLDVEQKTITPKPETKIDGLEKTRMELIQAQKEKHDKEPKMVKEDKEDSDFGFDITDILSIDNLAKMFGNGEMDIINLLRKHFKKNKLPDTYIENNINGWKIFIAWLQKKYGDEWFEYLPLIVFGVNQATTIGMALTEP